MIKSQQDINLEIELLKVNIETQLKKQIENIL